MRLTTGTLLGLFVLVCLFIRLHARFLRGPASSQPFSWWQKLAGLVALTLALLILLNPELLAMGLLGDTAFFDVLVLGLSLQLQAFAIRILRCAGVIAFGRLRWIFNPRLSFWRSYYAIAAIGNTLSSLCKAARDAFPGSCVRIA